MTFFTNLFSPDTYETFSRSNQEVSGFSKHQHAWAKRVQKGDRFVCYMTKLSRWVGVLEVLGECYPDESPLFYPEGDPYVIRFKVCPVVWLPKDQAIPIREKHIWDTLSFTKGVEQKSAAWTGKVRISLNKLSDEDGQFLQSQLLAQQTGGQRYPVDEDEYRRWLAQKVRRPDKVVPVTVPADNEGEEP
ncbi:MAG TPA: EVE domain-containing protein, partial [Gemmata sp.]